MSRERGRVRVVSQRLAAVCLGLGVALVVSELTLRVFGLAPVGGVATVTATDFDRIPGILMPKQRVVDKKKPDLAHRIRVDSLGYRGDDFPRQKPEGEYRIVFTGASGTWGEFVDDGESLPAQFAETLRAVCARTAHGLSIPTIDLLEPLVASGRGIEEL